MRRQEIVQLFNTINGLKLDTKNTKFNYALLKNKKRLADEIAIIQEMNKSSPEFKTYDDERVAACQKYALKKEDGTYEIEHNQYKFTDEARAELQVEIDELHVKYADVIAARDEAIKKFNEFMLEETSIHIHLVSIDDFPGDLSMQQMEVLNFMVQE
jgi:hypothetical protein